MARVPVNLDDEPRITPEKVDDVIEERDVHFWLGKVVRATESQEAFLQFAAGGG